MTSFDIDIDIICKSYDRNPFVQKTENNCINVYNFKFRGEEVCITINHITPDDTVFVKENGEKIWYYNAIRIYRNKRLHSGRLQRPESVLESGESKKQLVEDKDFRKCFANPYAYGTHNWPNSTILLYKYSTNAISKYWEIPEDTWKKIVNTDQHAEEIMIEDLEKIQDYLAIQPDDYNGSYKAILSIEVILSYSPCDKCSQRLCQFKKTLDKKVKQSKTRSEGSDTVLEKISALSLTTEIEEAEKVKFKITFSNFYKHISRTYGPTHIEGLENLMKSDIKLDIFTKENWDYFFNAAGLVTERPCRQRREKDDRKILQYLEQSVALYKMQEALEATEKDLQNNDLL